jgi:hypothetical protein
MNYIQKTPFMELYEELSILNEEAVLDYPTDTGANPTDLAFGQITVASCTAVDKLVATVFKKFEDTLKLTNTALKLPEREILRPKGIMLCLDESKFHAEAVRAYVGSNIYNYPTGSVDKDIDLTGSRLGFCFISNTIKYNPDFGDKLIQQLKNTFGEPFNVSSARLMQPKVGTQIRKRANENVFGIFIKYDKKVKTALTNICDEFTPSISINKANDFIKKFNTLNDPSYKTSTTSGFSTDIQTASDLEHIAFYIPGLVNYYQSNATLKDRAPLLSLLSLFDCKVSQGKKSLQYLYNAGLQEDIIEELGEAIGLERNTEATHTYNVPDKEKYHYLLKSNTAVGEISSKTDFLFKGYSVDAKIYGNTALMQKYTSNEDKSSHGAHFLIVYLKYVSNNEPRWRLLYRQDPNDSFKDWYKEPAHDFEAAKTLATLIKNFPNILLLEL